jgi:chromosome segregation ATPase
MDKIKRRDEMIREISRQMGWQISGSAQLDDMQVNQFLDELAKLMEKNEAALQKLKSDFHQSESELNDRLQQINSTKQSHEEIKSIRKKTRVSYNFAKRILR